MGVSSSFREPIRASILSLKYPCMSKRKAPATTKRKRFPITRVMEALRQEVERWPTPVVTVFSEQKASPYEILISTIISLRTQDKTTAEASHRLFGRAKTPAAMVGLRAATIEKLIYPAGFYKNKARTILEISRELIDDHGGQVPDDVDRLVEFKGVGRKTANLVVTLGFGKPGICVDTHVHRITQRWGYLESPNPDRTETILRQKLPKKYWIPINDWLVTFGQNQCKPVSPLCSTCALSPYCDRVDVAISR